MRAAAVIALLLAGCATGRSTEPPPAAPIGAAVSCIPITLIRESRVRNDQVIDWVMKDRRVFRTTLPFACPNLGYERRFAYSTSLTQLCSADIITVFSTAPIQRGASCGLAPFQPVDPIVGRR